MKKISILIGLSFILAGLGAQNFYDFKGAGARAAGMAFAFNAVADDATAITWNPAGITQLKKPEFSLIQRVTLENYKYEDLEDSEYNYTQDGKPYYNVDYLSFVYPIKIGNGNLVFGLSYQNQINYKFDYDLNYDSDNYTGSAKGKTTVNSVSFCAGITLTKFLSMGLAVNRYFSLGNSNQWNYVFRFGSSTTYIEDNGVYSFSGTNAIVGAFLDFSAFEFPLRFAVRVNTPFKLKNEFSRLTDYHYEYTSSDDYEVYRRAGTETYEIPFIIGTGVSYRIGDYLTLALDYDIKPFKDSKRIDQHDRYDDRGDTPIDDRVEGESLLIPTNDNLNQVRFGVEYILHPDFAFIPLRIGMKNNPTNVADMDENGDPTDQVGALSINAGFGLVTRNFSVDFAYEYYGYKNEAVNDFKGKHTLNSLILSVIVYIGR